ncbi:MAG: threonine/serine exporter family protein [Aerococcus sp.]|nr:threonine/serine exporter family protein [Aerococcus sp.]
MSGYLMQLVAAYVVGIFCTLSIEGPRNLMFKVSIIDVVGWGTYLLALNQFNLSLPMANYVAGLVIAGMSHWFARMFHEPVTVFFIPGFFTLVPGGGMYRTAFYLFRGDTHRGLAELSTTLFIALAIALAVFTVDSLVSIIMGQRFLKFIRRSPRRLRGRNGEMTNRMHPKSSIDPNVLRLSKQVPLSLSGSSALMKKYAEQTSNQLDLKEQMEASKADDRARWMEEQGGEPAGVDHSDQAQKQPVERFTSEVGDRTIEETSDNHLAKERDRETVEDHPNETTPPTAATHQTTDECHRNHQ